MQLKVVGVGPQKTGTTWLDLCLREHPQLCFPKGTKETFFFDERFDKGWSWYFPHFKHCTKDQFCIEIAPSYFDVPETATRIYQHNQNCRIIVSLRDPVARAFSLYLHHRNKGRLNCDFLTAIQKMPRIIESSHYRIHLSRWIELFGREQVHIILQDDISACPEHTLKQIYKFIGISDSPMPKGIRERINIAANVRFPSMARFFDRKAKWFRDRRLYGIINLLKMLGVKELYTRASTDARLLEPESRNNLTKEFEKDIEYVEKLLRRQLPEWR